jgi:hypothetical protein
VAPPTYYCCRNTQMPEEKSWNENKVLQHSNTDYKNKKISVNLCNLWTNKIGDNNESKSGKC